MFSKMQTDNVQNDTVISLLVYFANNLSGSQLPVKSTSTCGACICTHSQYSERIGFCSLSEVFDSCLH